MSRLRLASRLAWRDVRRRKGRTLLVILLITIPVSAMAYGDGLYRTSNDQSATFVRRFGKIDLAVHPPSFADSNETGQVPPSKIGAPQYSIAALKASVDRNVPNATSEIVTQTSISLRAQDAKPRRIQATITDLRVDDPMNAGIIDISAGRAPTKQGEVLLSRQLARFFRVRVGDSLHFAVPKTDVVVVGVGRVTDDYQSQTIYAYTSSDFPATFMNGHGEFS